MLTLPGAILPVLRPFAAVSQPTWQSPKSASVRDTGHQGHARWLRRCASWAAAATGDYAQLTMVRVNRAVFYARRHLLCCSSTWIRAMARWSSAGNPGAAPSKSLGITSDAARPPEPPGRGQWPAHLPYRGV